MTQSNGQGLPGFVGSMSSVTQDSFIRVVNRLTAMGSGAALEALEERLKEIRQAINDVNERRDALRLEREDLARVITALDEALATTQAADLVQIRLVLQTIDADLEAKIAKTRPEELHEEKAFIRQELARRRLLAKLAGMIKRSSRTT